MENTRADRKGIPRLDVVALLSKINRSCSQRDEVFGQAQDEKKAFLLAIVPLFMA